MATRSLALAVDNTRPSPPRPGYRQALRDGICQKCRKPGVRTVGMREPGQVTFKKLALCPACVAVAQSEGYYPVLAAVRIPADTRELASSAPEDTEPGRLPAARVPVTVARFAGKCPACADPVAVGEVITRGAGDGKWRHARCAGLRIRHP
jgi:hypothetical protein